MKFLLRGGALRRSRGGRQGDLGLIAEAFQTAQQARAPPSTRASSQASYGITRMRAVVSESCRKRAIGGGDEGRGGNGSGDGAGGGEGGRRSGSKVQHHPRSRFKRSTLPGAAEEGKVWPV